MNDDLLNKSLKQGKQFNTYQNKIKHHITKIDNKTNNPNTDNNEHKQINKIEGFVSSLNKEQIVRPNYDGYLPVLKNIKETAVSINEANQNDLDTLNKLKSKYLELMQKYTIIQNKITDTSFQTINRMSSDNPYLGKNIKFSDGKICYVTNQGVIRPYSNPDILNGTQGKNGCPSKDVFVNINMPWKNSYTEGTIIPLDAPLVVGTNMKLGESCGNEGKNVYASKLVNSPTNKYIGCYNDVEKVIKFDVAPIIDKSIVNDSLTQTASTTTASTSGSTKAMNLGDDMIGYTTFDKCQEYALDNGYKYFGLQDVRNDGTAKCLVSNDITRTKKYGDGSLQTKLIPIWSSNSKGSGASASITSDGRLVINDNSGLLWQSSESLTNCLYGGYVNPKSIQGSWGGNCVGKPLGAECAKSNSQQTYGTEGIVGNLNSILQNKASEMLPQGKTPQYNWTFNPIELFNKQDPAPCCSKEINYSYQCGGAPFKNGQIAGGSNISFDCSNEVSNCSFILRLESDGNVCLLRGTPDKIKEQIWCTGTSGKQQVQNPDWVSTKGKFGRNYLKMNELLGPGEWIGSDNGTLKLIMQTNGNLVLYTSELIPGCKSINNKMYGNDTINAVYELDSLGTKSALGKIGYIDSESKLRQYPDSMIEFTNNYQIYQNADSVGNNITTLISGDQNDCQTKCNNMKNCSAYVYQGSSKTCWLKNNSAYPKGNKQINDATILGVRQPGLKGSATCSNQVANVDTIQYENYNKGAQMNSNTRCIGPIVSQKDQLEYDNILSQLVMIGNDIVSKMENLYNEDGKLFEKLKTNKTKFNEELTKYKETNKKINKKLLFRTNNNIENNQEGMQNLINVPNMNDLNGMLLDSELRVLKENYSYILWSILAVGIITVTINNMKK